MGALLCTFKSHRCLTRWPYSGLPVSGWGGASWERGICRNLVGKGQQRHRGYMVHEMRWERQETEEGVNRNGVTNSSRSHLSSSCSFLLFLLPVPLVLIELKSARLWGRCFDINHLIKTSHKSGRNMNYQPMLELIRPRRCRQFVQGHRVRSEGSKFQTDDFEL